MLKPNRDAERALVAEYRAAIADNVPALELSAAEERKRQRDPNSFQDYRVATALAFDGNAHAVLADLPPGRDP